MPGLWPLRGCTLSTSGFIRVDLRARPVTLYRPFSPTPRGIVRNFGGAWSAQTPKIPQIQRKPGTTLVAWPLPLRRLRETTIMVSRERIQGVLDRVRPFLLADGGDIELLAVNGNSADVRLRGMCAGCPSAHMTLHLGVEAALREEIPEFDTLRVL